MNTQPTPQSEETERTVLGTILLQNEAIKQTVDLTPEHFFTKSNAMIFAAMNDMAENATEIDITTLGAELESRKQLNQCGGYAYLAQLTDGVTPRANIKHYVDILTKHKTKRELLMLAHDVTRMAYDPTVATPSVIDKVHKRVTEIAKELAAKDKEIFVPAIEFVKQGNKSVEWRVERVIEKGTNGIIQALPKTGKSLAVAYLAACLCTGIPFFDLDVSPCRVALVSREDFAGTTARRLRRIFLGMGLNPDENIYGKKLWVNTREQSKSLALDNPRDLANLIANLQKREIEFVILDVLNVLHSATDENDAAEMRQVMKQVEMLSKETGAQIAIVHHKKKGDTSGMTLSESGRGSSAIAGFAEFIIDFRMVDEENEIREARFETKAAGKYRPFFWKAIDQQTGALNLERTQYEGSGKRKAAKVV